MVIWTSDRCTQWLQQLSEMQQSIADLKLDDRTKTIELNNATDVDVDFEDDEYSSGTVDDIWDVISSDEESDDFDDINGVLLPSGTEDYSYAWLVSKCETLASQRSGFGKEELLEQITAVLAADSGDDELQMSLAEIVGFDNLDLVIDLIAHRQKILSPKTSRSAAQTDGLMAGRLQTLAEREQSLRRQDHEHKHTPLAGAQTREGPKYPHVYKVHDSRNTLSLGGKKYGLPNGSDQVEHQKYTEISVPASRGISPVGPNQKLVQISSLDGLCRGTFKGYKTLNRMQSLLYEVAYKTSENMLICAPTGAGKTDAAMLTILNAISKNIIPNPLEESDATEFTVQLDDFKVVYVAPMKALAAEVTEKLGKRLAWLGIQVRELTGDMQLSKREIVETQIIVTTPEKWDVVTRKSTGDTELVQKVRLLIIDEVHMLHDERGAVIESLVARTERQVESTQSLIRIVGLSATLPNYIDVADFLKVNRMAGLFFFDQSFRPVPLEQHFVGVKGKPGSKQSRENLDAVAFEKVRDMLEQGHQVMVFVHSRKDTVLTARTFKQMAAEQQCEDLFLTAQDTEGYSQAVKDLKGARARELRDLFAAGFGAHHAGLTRSDRNLMEPTLAWAVVIKGTQLYSAQEGKFIFGRAGRPQFQDTGIGFICTTHDKLHHYLSAVTSQQPIESRFSAKLVDNLNAEISLGTVTSVAEAREPRNYGIEWAEIRDDPMLVQRRRELIKSQMIIFNERTEELRAKDVGRIASQYYIFNDLMRPQASEADVLRMISLSGEFDNIQARENESKELERLRGNDSPHAKTNILLQSYISRAKLEDFALQSARICRSLFMIALNRRWGYQCQVLLSMCKSIEKQIWPFQHPFHQFDLPLPILKNLDEKLPTSSVQSMREMEPAEIGQLLLDNFPTLSVEAEIAPLNRDVLRIRLSLYPDFIWNDRHHGNSDTSEIYHHEYFILSRKKLYDEHELNFTIPLSDPLPSQIYTHLIRPDTESVYTDLLDLQPLPISALKNPILEEIYGARFQYFNPMQTQIFHTLYHTSANVLLGSPTGSGKTVACELAMWWAFRENPGSKVVYIAPMKALVRERVQDWRKRLTAAMGLRLVELTGDNTPDTRTIRDADIIITTPEKWDGISRSWQTRGYVRQIHLLGGDRGPILEIIVSRMNYIASQSKGSVRLMGMSTACANATDLANWLGVKEGLYNFRHSVRPVPLEIFIDGFPEQRGFCPLMQSMNRPTFLAIKNHSPEKPVIVFVASRRQTRLTAKDLINYCGMEDNPRRFVRMSEDDLQLNLTRVKDDALREALSFGIGLHHAGLVESDRQLAEELFANNKIQILVATSTLAWGVNLPAHLVVVKGTQFFDAKIEGYRDMDLTDVLQMLGRAGRPQFDDSGIARIFTQDAKKAFYKHFLHTGFPVESTLHKVLDNHLGAEVSAGTIVTKQDALDYLTWTFFFRRLHKNPSYYGLEISADEHNTIAAQQIAAEFMIDLVDKSLSELAESSCVILDSATGEVDPTPFGKIMSYYYLSHRTVRYLMSHAKRDPTFQEVLAWMCSATEFDELPVRHNEDLINAELSRNLPLSPEPMGDLPMWDPHIKAFLLLQAYMSRIDLPISDYVGDQTSVLDQGIRIIQASIDILAELGYMPACRMMMTLLQCIKSARWPEDHPLSILPNIEPDAIKPKTGLPDSLIALTSSRASTLASKLPSVSLHQLDRIISTLPRISISLSTISTTGMTLTLSRQNPPSTPDFKIYAPRFPKPQTEGYFLVVSDERNGDLVALKRVSWSSTNNNRKNQTISSGKGKSQGGRAMTTTTTTRATVKFPGGVSGTMRVNVRIISDAYIGMEWAMNGIKIPVEEEGGESSSAARTVETDAQVEK
ncbi:putative DEAD/DEAH box helicase [Talaromyces proteolyticus]|uniref:DEAD/DEAH box helicase n=1 Tax=Talaromyces proteolyticus TaxID=1131652 RepID=A0AAD4KDX6_9EURO|nr:putative DEAD/DEAH box helicase [Talaromyces proteolyticus]KAH8689942.1 putative DEAD/DEAH box helicase [Talaromyces proteolyticus]